jgi:hypothetical protein
MQRNDNYIREPVYNIYIVCIHMRMVAAHDLTLVQMSSGCPVAIQGNKINCRSVSVALNVENPTLHMYEVRIDGRYLTALSDWVGPSERTINQLI